MGAGWTITLLVGATYEYGTTGETIGGATTGPLPTVTKLEGPPMLINPPPPYN